MVEKNKPTGMEAMMQILSQAKENQDENSEPVDLRHYIEQNSDHEIGKLFTPRNFAKFVLSGQF